MTNPKYDLENELNELENAVDDYNNATTSFTFVDSFDDVDPFDLDDQSDLLDLMGTGAGDYDSDNPFYD